jgi:hypothetical protein
MLGITVLASVEDVMAVLRTAVLFAKSLRTPLLVDIAGKTGDCSDLWESARSSSGVLNPIEKRLRAISPAHATAFVLEATVTAASFVAAGTISVRVRRVDSNTRGKRR